MKALHRLSWMALALAWFVSPARAQAVKDVSGHWEGTVAAPGTEIGFQVDLGKNDRGESIGAISVPAQQLKGLPLQKIIVDNDARISFQARSDQVFRGQVSADGQSIAGDYSVEGATIPFTLIRRAPPTLEPPVRSARITRELEGTWNGTLSAGGGSLRVVLELSNQPDGTAIGTLVNIDEGGLRIPLAIEQSGTNVKIGTQVIASSYVGVLNADGTELTGTFTQGAIVAPLTLHRVPAAGRK
jgi:hypothetical protein